MIRLGGSRLILAALVFLATFDLSPWRGLAPLAASYGQGLCSLTQITPMAGPNTASVSTVVTGSGFTVASPPTVRLTRLGQTINATAVSVISSTQVTCQFNLMGLSAGKYDVIVDQAGCPTIVLSQGFLVIASAFQNGSFEYPLAPPNCGGDTWGVPTGWNRNDDLHRDGSVWIPDCYLLPDGGHYGSMSTGEGENEYAWQTVSVTPGMLYYFAGLFSGGGTNLVRIKLLDGDETGPVLGEAVVHAGGGFYYWTWAEVVASAVSDVMTIMWEMTEAFGPCATHADALGFEAMVMLCTDPFADVDADGDVDGVDFDNFQRCLSGPGEPLMPGCECFDQDVDNDVDQADLAVFEACFSGPDIVADPACDSGFAPGSSGAVDQAPQQGALSAPSQAGSSTIQYTLELGGDNHAQAYEDLTPARFAPGNPADRQQYTAGEVITWDVAVEVTGADFDGLETNGAANLVFTMELHHDTCDGPLVNIGRAEVIDDVPVTAGWFSSVNDGDADGPRGALLGPDPLHNAAFCNSFEVAGAWPTGPLGRAFDSWFDGGPHLNHITYPSAAGWPTSAFTWPGRLVGMQAGYRQFYPFLGGGEETAGVGISLESCSGPYCDRCLGALPVFEGQISTVGLAPGTYCLVLIPEGGNVLSGAFDCQYTGAGRFALGANTVQGDAITFNLVGGQGDLDGDGDVDIDDFDIFLAAFGHSVGQPQYNQAADLDQDGTVTFVDYQRWLQAYREANGGPQIPAPLQVLGDFGLDGHVDAADLEHLEACATGPGLPLSNDICRDADLDVDGDVDQSDFGFWQRCSSGPDRMVDLSCKY